MDKYSFLNAAHTAYFADLYEQYLDNPDSVEPSLRAFFQGFDFGSENYGINGEIVDGATTQIPEQVQKEFQVIKLIDGYRSRGHLFTKTNPVRERRQYTPTLEIENFGLTKQDLNTVFNAGDILGIGPQKLDKIIFHLERIYCDSIGVEYMFIRNPEEIQWWQNKLNENDNHPNYTSETKKYVLTKLTQAVTFEQFLQTKFVGQKRFSLEGGETLIPALGAIVRIAAELYDFDGDVKYHLGSTIKKTLKSNKEITMNLVPNPSHLEAVGSIVEGITRAKIDEECQGNSSKIVPIIVHGDAAVAGQGIVYELIQMSKLKGYSTGGTIHIVVNNQIGFTTNYLDARSSTYCTDVAKVTLSPVLHVNADDVEAVTHAILMALDFRMKFKRDVFIDLLGYRKYGHNEGDEPRFTQPMLYSAIAKQPNPRDVYNDKLIAEGVIDENHTPNLITEYKALLEKEFDKSKEDVATKVKPFMDNVWHGFMHQDLEGLLLSVGTKYPKKNLEKIKNV